MPQKKRHKIKNKKAGKTLRQLLSSDEDTDSIPEHSTFWSMNVHEEVINDSSDKANKLMEDLTSPRPSIRMSSLKKLAKLFKLNFLKNFALDKNETLIQYLISCIRKGRTQEVCAACRVFALLVVTLGVDMRNIYTSVWTFFDTYIRNPANTIAARSIMIELLSIICFTCEQEDEETLKSMKLLFQIWKRGKNEMLTSQALKSWSLLCTIAPQTMAKKQMEMCLPYLVRFLDHRSLEVRISAGEGAALGYICFSENDHQSKKDGKDSKINISTIDWYLDLLMSKVEELSKDQNRRRSKKERATQRSIFRDILQTFKERQEPSEVLQIGKNQFKFCGWVKILQLNAFRQCLDIGLQFHLQKNDFLASVFDLSFEPNNNLQYDVKEKQVRRMERTNRARIQTLHLSKERKKRLPPETKLYIGMSRNV